MVSGNVCHYPNMDIQQGIVYALSCTCHPDEGWRYVGMTLQRATVRMKAHRHNAKNGMALPVYNWMRKHGIENVVMTPLSLHEDRTAMGLAEAKAIQVHGTHVSVGGLNVTLGGDGGVGFKHSAETRAAMSIAHSLRERSPETVAKIAAANTGSKRTTEQKRRISESITGRVLTDDTKAKMRQAHLGRGKLTETDVTEIKKQLRAGDSQRLIASRFGVTPGNIASIHQGRTWSHIS